MRNEQQDTADGIVVTDLDDSYKGKNILSFAYNSTLVTHQGNAYFRSNEESPTFCVQAPYDIIGHTPISGNKFLIFSTDNLDSEIGVINELDCSYQSVINSKCLNFHKDFPIFSKFKVNDKGEEIITFVDNRNSDRVINLQNIPYKFTVQDDECQTREYTDELDCDGLLLSKVIGIPEIEVTKGFGGALEDGAYQVLFAYSIEGQKYSDYYGPTVPIHINSDSGGGSLVITINNLDRTFDEYDIIVIGTVNGVSTPKKIGTFPTSTSSVTISEFNREEYITIPFEFLTTVKKVWDKSGFLSGNSEYLIRADVSSKPIPNVQIQLEDVEAEYVVHQYPLRYYKDDGKHFSLWRDEVYSYFIRYLYGTGDYTPDYHLYGRSADSDDRVAPNAQNAPEILDVNNTLPRERWLFENTSGKIVLLDNEFVNGHRVYGYGKLAYWESSEKYPDNRELFGENACTPIRHHKTPNEENCPRYSVINGETYINVLGIRFKNLPYPVDKEGNPIPNIVGYEILRGDRTGGNKTVIARGLATNARGYSETQGQQLDVVYANGPFNDVRPDNYLSSIQTSSRNNRENNYRPLTTVYNDKFNFYSPHGYFENKYRMGNVFQFETEEVAPVEGLFEEVYNHPKDKLITNFTLYFSLLMGAIQGLYATSPKYTRTTTTTREATASIPPEVTVTTVEEATAEDSQAFSNIFTSVGNIGKNLTQIAKRVLQTIAKAGMFIYFSAEYAANVLRIAKNFSRFEQYAIQYNSFGRFNQQLPVQRSGIRRNTIRQPLYLSPNLHNVGDLTVNNYQRQQSVFVELNSGVPFTRTQDNTRTTLSQFRTTLNTKVNSTASAFYATSKIVNRNQYGNLESIRKVKTHDNPIPISIQYDQLGYLVTFDSPDIFGGDCVIAEFSVLNKTPFFSQSLEGFNNPDDVSFDYRMYRNVAYPRFWADFSEYELGDMITQSPSMGRLPAQKHNLDNRGNSSSSNAWTILDRYFYLSVNGAMSFICEADYNISFRKETDVPHFSEDSTNISNIFRSDNLSKPEKFELDKSYHKLQSNEFFSQTINSNYNSDLEETVRSRDRNGLVYSLPSFKGQSYDNWLYFLPGNYFSFNNSDFGNLTGIHKLDQDRVIFLFDKASPYISVGRDQLETVDGRKITIGDGGLFAQQPRELMNTDIYYGSTQSRFAFSSTPFGYFYPSARAGRIFQFTGGLDDITRNGFSYWAKQFMPIKLIEYFPDFNLPDNPVNGVGYLTWQDGDKELIYVTKRDFIPNPNVQEEITFDPVKGQFLFRDFPISLRDTDYFQDISFTLSYSPTKKGLISWHGWFPDMIIQTEKHFMGVYGNQVWKHNNNCQSFCNYFGEDQPFILEFVANTGKETHILSSLQYILEAYKYRNDCRDKFHVLNENFDYLVVHNSEQVSPPLNLVHKPIDLYEADTYPKPGGAGYDILYSKEENKYRINQFWDSTKDRGEFTQSEFHLFNHSPNGVDKTINPVAIDLNKEERKKFRHYINKVLFSKRVSGSVKLLVKIVDFKLRNSPR